MIKRIVKLQIDENKTEQFIELFNKYKDQIAGQDGCTHLELWQEPKSPQIFFTYSHWNSEKHLNDYRHSKIFSVIWPETKKLFDGKPEAWTVQQLS